MWITAFLIPLSKITNAVLPLTEILSTFPVKILLAILSLLVFEISSFLTFFKDSKDFELKLLSD